MKRFKEYITEDLAAEKNLHISHIEELMVLKGRDGLKKILELLNTIINKLSDVESSNIQIKTKWDGAPSLIVGINPENKKFFVGTKSVFNKLSPKINYTAGDIEKNHDSVELQKKLKIALKYLPELGIKTILQGDMLFTHDDLQHKTIEGVPYLIFRPNTITYAIPEKSELAKEIDAAKMGIVFHTEYKGSDIANLKSSLKIDISNLHKSKNVWYRDADFDNMAHKIDVKKEDVKKLNDKMANLKFLMDNLDKSFLDKVESDSDLSSLLMNFHNFLVRSGSETKTAKEKTGIFIQYVKDKFEGEISTLKTDAGKDRKKKKLDYILSIFLKNKRALTTFLALDNIIVDIKLDIIKKLNELRSINTFVNDDEGKYSPTDPEGFVAVTDDNTVKLIDRNTFSKNNFNMPKNWKK